MRWFIGELNRFQRKSNGFGPEPLGYDGIGWWAQLTGRQLNEVELHWLLVLDEEYRLAVAKSRPQKGGKSN